MKKLFLVDAYAIVYKMYYAFLGRPMKNAEGFNTSAIFGFTKYIRDIIRKERPHYLGIAFDSKGPTFRHEMYEEYKANRQAAPEDIHASIPFIKEVIHAMRIPCLEMPGYEADDIIGTLSCKAANQGFQVYMVTPDKDFGQLIGPNVFIYKQRKSGEGIEIVGPDRIKEVYGVDDPCLIADILAIWGDASDNIPGVAGIGEKGAIKLVSEFGSVEDILDNLDKLPAKQREKLEAGRQDVLMSKKLAMIERDVPIPFEPEKLVMEDPDVLALSEVFHRMGFSMFHRELENGTFIPSLGPADIDRETAGSPPAQATADLFTQPAAKPQSSPDLPAPGVDSAVQGDLFGAALPNTPQKPKATLTTGDPQILTTVEQVEALARAVRQAGEMGLYTATSGPDMFSDRIIGVGIAAEDQSWYVPFDKKDPESPLLPAIRDLLTDQAIVKAGYNIKTDLTAWRVMSGVEISGQLLDVMILHYLLESESRHTIGYLSRTYLDYTPLDYDDLAGKGAKQKPLTSVPLEQLAAYASEQAAVSLKLSTVLGEIVQEQGLTELYSGMEEPLIRVLADIEMTGVRIDSAALFDYGQQLSVEIASLEQQIREITGEPALNVNSAKQLGEALFGKMNLDPKPKLTKTKQYRTDEEYLQSLAPDNPVIGLVLRYRGLRKLMSTYIEALPSLVNKVTGKLHTSFNQAVTSTGRLSSTNPNLQNIPIRNEQGREIRRSFVPSGEDYLVLSVDYSQVELRLMAHLSGDRGMLEAFAHSEDIHAATAAKIFNIPLSEVTPEQRRRAKTANFGIIYGISAFGLSQRLNIPRTEAKEIIEGYFRSYPGVKDYMESVIRKAAEDGYVCTLFGRKRFLPDIRSANAVTRGLAERNAINAPIQGSAADIMKIAMIDAHRRLAKAGLRSKIILQVHDELVIDLYAPERETVIEIIVDSMENAAKLEIGLPVDYGIGKNWLEAH